MTFVVDSWNTGTTQQRLTTGGSLTAQLRRFLHLCQSGPLSPRDFHKSSDLVCSSQPFQERALAQVLQRLSVPSRSTPKVSAN